MIDVALHKLIAAATGLGLRVTPSTETVLVTKALPRLVYTLIGVKRRYSDKGNCGLTQARYQLDIFAEKATEARAIADALRVSLDGKATTFDGTKIDRIYFDSEQFARGDGSEGANKVPARYSQDLIVEYRESA
jgi:hypothetical protein